MQSIKPAVAVKKTQGDNVALKDANLVYRACTMAFAKSMGCASPNEIIGKTDFDLLPAQVAQQQQNLDAQTLRSAKTDINTIALRPQPDQANKATSVIVRAPVFGNDKLVNGIEVRLVGGPSFNPQRSKSPVDFDRIMREGSQGSLIINDLSLIHI